jgi:hypothetical protein
MGGLLDLVSQLTYVVTIRYQLIDRNTAVKKASPLSRLCEKLAGCYGDLAGAGS